MLIKPRKSEYGTLLTDNNKELSSKTFNQQFNVETTPLIKSPYERASSHKLNETNLTPIQTNQKHLVMDGGVSKD